MHKEIEKNGENKFSGAWMISLRKAKYFRLNNRLSGIVRVPTLP